ncbi:MAG: hypothetical protein Q7R44_00145 [bacterium]|nr:hypothetical protein [bacterium]
MSANTNKKERDRMKSKRLNKKRMVKVEFTNDALGVLAMIGNNPKDPTERRIARIRRNLVLAVDALNKELVRHIPKIKIRRVSIERFKDGTEIHRPIPERELWKN